MMNAWFVVILISLFASLLCFVGFFYRTKLAVNKRIIMATVGALLLFVLIGFVGSRIDSMSLSFWIMEGITVIFGIVSVLLLYRLIPQVTPTDFWSGAFYLTALLFGGMAIVAAVISFLAAQSGFVWQVSLATLPFLFPYLFYQSYIFWESIPAKKYQRWQYPVKDRIPVIEPIDTIAVDFRVSQKPNQEPVLVCPVNAPRNKSLGTIFHYLVYDYNTRNQQNPISIYADPTQDTLAGWVFQTDSQVVDPNKSLKDNKLSDGMIISARSFTD